jgi:tripeptide aminopeptidase
MQQAARTKSNRTKVPQEMAEAPPVEPQRALDLILEMLPIPGLSGHEGQIMEFITKKLRDAGVPRDAIVMDDVNRRSPLGGDVGNLICKLPGTIRGPRRLLMAHADTVPLCVGTQPVVKNGYIASGNPATGLGADNRSGSSAILNAAIEIVRNRLPHPPLTFLWAVQEEVGLLGARFVKPTSLGNPKLCFNWDGNEPHRVTVGATGAYKLHIDINGMASHAGVAPEKGVSAVGIAGLAIADLQSNGWHGLIKKGTRQGTSNIGIIAGGNATNVVTSHVNLVAEARSHDSKFRKQIVQAFRQAFLIAAEQVRNHNGAQGKVTFRADLNYESFRLEPDEPSVVHARRAIAQVGMEPDFRISNGGLDANWLSARGMPTVTLGAGQLDVHTVNERLDIAAFLQGCRVALALATGA